MVVVQRCAGLKAKTARMRQAHAARSAWRAKGGASRGARHVTLPPRGRGVEGLVGRRPSRRAGESASCGAGLVEKLNTQELEVALSNRDKPVVIDFFATWCGPCVVLSKVLDEIAEEFGEDVRFVKVDTDEETELANYFQIQGLPTLMFIGKDKGKVLRAEGLLPAQQIKDMIKEVS